MRIVLGITILCAACGAAPKTAPPPTAPPKHEEVTPPAAPDPREVQLRTMTELLGLLADRVVEITASQPPSNERCDALSELIATWGEEHDEAYDAADGEGAYLGLTEADVANHTLRALAVELAHDSALLMEKVDQACLFGDNSSYGDELNEYLLAYQGLEHWVKEGDSSLWAYEALIAE